MRYTISKFASLVSILLLGFNAYAQSTNVFLDRDYWNKKPVLEEVQQKVKDGNDPAELNQFAFDAPTWAILENNSLGVIKYLLEQKGNEVNKLTHDGRSYIFWAAYRDNLELMEYLVSKGATTNIIDDHGYSLINFAAVTGQQNLKLYDFIIKHQANAFTNKNRDGANALLLLMPFLKEDELINYFQAKGLNIHDQDNNGDGAFNYAAKGGNISMMNWLIEHNVEYKKLNNKGGNAMLLACQGMRRASNSLNVFEYLNDKGIQPNIITTDGVTPLMIYAKGGEDIKVFEYFLKNGVDPNATDKDGNTALLNASAGKEAPIIKLLVQKTSKLDAVNKKGETALTRAVQWNSAEVVDILLKSGASPNVENPDGNNIIYYLVESYNSGKKEDYEQKVEMLSEKGVQLTSVSSNGNSLLHWAAQSNKLELLNKAKELKLDINAQNKEGLSPLHIAAMKANNDKVLRYLIENGADKNLRTAFDESAYELARENEILKQNHVNLDFLEE